MFFVLPIYYDELMKKVPKGKLITIKQMRSYLAKKNNADFTDSMTAGLFMFDKITAQKNQSFQIDLIVNVTLVRRFYLMEQVRRIELPSQPWQGYILTIEPHLRLRF